MPHQKTLLADTLNRVLHGPGVRMGRHALLIIRLTGLNRLRGMHNYRWCDNFNHETQGALRALIPKKDCFCQIDQDEYGLLITHIDSDAIVELAAAKIRNCFDALLKKHKARVSVRVVVGAVVIADGDLSADDVLLAAHTTALEAELAHSSLKVREMQQTQTGLSAAVIEGELFHAVSLGQFELWLQPQLDLRTSTISSSEALIRWHLPETGMIPPDLFIPISEKCGVIHEVTDWVIHNAARITRRLHDQGYIHSTSINISGINLTRSGLVEALTETLSLWGLAPQHFTLELTEGAVLGNLDDAKTTLARCSELGFRISMDDFGTGYSSLNYLRQLPLDELKIDRSFILDLPRNERDQRLVRTILSLAENFDVEVVAEGVEDEESANLLKELGCSKIQGYWLSRPLKEDKLADFFGHVTAALPQWVEGTG